MNAHNPLRAPSLLCATLLTVACSGGSAGFSGIDRTGEPRFGFAFGTVTGFGSIIVNGVHYETDSSTFDIDDSPGSQDDLSVGDVVLVEATQASGSTTWNATSVTFDDNVEGPISSIDPTTNSFVALGQTVIVNANTSFDDGFANPSLDGLVIGDIVEVTGFVNANGAIVATRIEPKPASTQFEVTGIVSAHNSGAMTVMINALVVDYSSAVSIRDFPGGVINDGDLVEIKGTAFDAPSTTLTASDVGFKGGQIQGDAGARVEIEGLVTRFVSQSDFDVSGVSVDASSATFEGDVANLGLNSKVEVEGALNGSNVLVAIEVDVRRATLIRIEAAVDSVDAGGNTFVTLGITVEVDALTRMEDKDSDIEPFTLDDLNPNDIVDMRGSVSSGSTADVLATLLERDFRDETALQGFVDSAADPVITILGVQIDTSGAEFRDENDAAMTRQDFFDRLASEPNALIQAVGQEVGTMAIDADRVEFEVEF
jgi:hypothetical protein